VKTSNRILGWIGIGIVAAVVALVIISRVIFGPAVEAGGSGRAPLTADRALSEEYVTSSHELSGFTGVRSTGGWSVILRHGDGYEVEVRVQKDLADDTTVAVRNGMLVLDAADTSGMRGVKGMYATVTMPALREVRSLGALELVFSGFEGPRLTVDVDGALSVRGEDNRYGRLDLESNGASDVKLAESRFGSASVVLRGAGDAVLTMDGGELSGGIYGAGRIAYYGEASRVDVDTSVVSRVDKLSR